MKKIIAVILAMASASVCGIPVNAAVGDKAGEALYTDICAYINHYPISSYAVNGTTAVVAEDLAQYGMNVVWDAGTRELNITRNTAADEITGGKGVYKSSYPTGTKFSDVYETDIRVFVEGIQVPAYALNGYTLVSIESLTPIGQFTYDNSTRSAKLWIDGLHIAPFVPTIPRVEKIYSAEPYTNLEYFEYWADINRDGTADPIRLSGTWQQDDYYMDIKLTMGGASVTVSSGFGVREAYLCDLSPYDDYMEVMLITEWENDWLNYEMFRYENGRLRKLGWNNVDYSPNTREIYFNVTGDNSFVLAEATESMGMWSCYVNYTVSYGGISRQTQDYYEVCPGFASQSREYMTYDELHRWGYVESWQEYTMLWYDYAMAHTDYYNYNQRYNSARPATSLRRGEYFKILYDDGNNWIYIQKSDGTGGWLDISFDYYGGFDYETREAISPLMFYMAG